MNNATTMNNATRELTFDRLEQVSGGYWPPPHSHPRRSNKVGAERYLPPNKNNDVRSSVLTFF